MDGTERIRKCHVERVVYQKDEFSIVLMSSDDEMNPIYAKDNKGKFRNVFTAKGYNLPTDMSVLYDIEGKWEEGKRFRGLRQFALKVDKALPLQPSSREEIIAFFVGNADGIGEITAKRIYDELGDDAIDKIRTDKDALAKVKMTNKQRASVRSTITDKLDILKSVSYLLEIGCNLPEATKVSAKFGGKSINIINENPYILPEIIGKNGFIVAEMLAERQGMCPTSTERIKAVLAYTMGTMAERRGHMYVDRETLYGAVDYLLSSINRPPIDRKLIEKFIENEKDSGIMELPKEEAVYQSFRYWQETDAAAKIADMSEAFYESQFDRKNRKIQGENSGVIFPIEVEQAVAASIALSTIELSSTQLLALKKALTFNVSVVTGGAGTGKTTLIKSLVDSYQRLKGDGPQSVVYLTAPTGKAAQRMSEICPEIKGITVHSLLGIGFEEDRLREEKENCITGMVVVDEASMLDGALLHKLTKALNPKAHLVLIGDVSQLPSVGAGNVLTELILSRSVPVTNLKTVFRQSEMSGILSNSQRIRKGEDVEFTDDFQFKHINNSEFGYVIDELQEYISKRFNKKIYDLTNAELKTLGDEFQVLSPYRKKGEMSVASLNRAIQSVLFYKREYDVKYKLKGDVCLHIGDKVINTVNTKDIMNGEIGYVIDITNEGSVAVIEFERKTVSVRKVKNIQSADGESSELELELAYALTVHKSQGSEYKEVVMPVVKEHAGMLNRKLIYTAVTRARDKVVLIGDPFTLKAGIKNDKERRRNSLLSKFLINQFKSWYDERVEEYNNDTQLCVS